MSATADHALSTPQQVADRLESIERDLAQRQNELEHAALNWFRVKRDLEHDYAIAYLAAKGTVEERKAQARNVIQDLGKEEEARYESMKAAIRVLETRAAIGMSLLKSQGRA